MLAMRNQWQSFMNCGTGETMKYELMGNGFTDLSESKNPTEYSRKYVHEQSERTDVTGFAPSLAYSMDYYTDDPVAQEIRKITDEELIGTEAQRDIVNVDVFDVDETTKSCTAYKRTYAIIPDGKGSGTDALIYTGNIKAAGDIVKGKFDMKTKAFTPDDTTTGS